MSRFILNLRTLDSSAATSLPTMSTGLSFKQSSPVMDNLGAPLDLEGEGNDDDYDGLVLHLTAETSENEDEEASSPVTKTYIHGYQDAIMYQAVLQEECDSTLE